METVIPIQNAHIRQYRKLQINHYSNREKTPFNLPATRVFPQKKTPKLITRIRDINDII